MVLVYHLQADPNPGAHVGANTRVKPITSANIGRAPPESIKNIRVDNFLYFLIFNNFI